MKTKIQYSLSFLSLLSLMAVNYYVSSNTVKYDVHKKTEAKNETNKKIDKAEILGTQKITTKTTKVKKSVAVNDIEAFPSLFELSNQLGAPILTETPSSELSYPE